ncbi:cyclin-dependent kinase F-1-like [Lycium ferocissimum]|uniref:cyclin-dependent kinase F-1-like n=1 Tax=Lycium ferocissimum TaxID=112874 RepID=UPI00281607A6|nr:cyclin-dependent kinase F-1-like [Lycium ferocissimum]
MEQPSTKSWSIYTRPEITTKYEIFNRIGAGAYSDVYKARRKSDSVTVALKEIHDYQSAFREIEALQTLQHCPNVVVLYEYFWREDEDAVLVLEYLDTDLGCLIKEAKNWENGLSFGEIKRWMVQILCGVDACHRNSIVHRDLKPQNLLISNDGILKLADFGQARILLAPGFVANDNQQPYVQSTPYQATMAGPSHFKHISDVSSEGGLFIEGPLVQADRPGESDELRFKSFDDTDKDSNIQDGDTSCLATGTMSNVEEDLLPGTYSYDVDDGEHDCYPPLTSCVGTRWYRAPELLYGSTNYGPEIDLWSLGCIFAEVLRLEPLFPGNSDIDQLGRIFSVLGNLSEEVWPGCADLPDYKIISFGKVDKPTGLEACLSNRSTDEILLVKKLLCFDPAGRATAMELLHDKYLNEAPLAVPSSELRIPSKHSSQYEDSPDELGGRSDLNSDSDFDDFGPTKVSTTNHGFSIQFS